MLNRIGRAASQLISRIERIIQLQQNGIYAIVELSDGLGLTNSRCSDAGYPLTGGYNVNGWMTAAGRIP